MFRRQHHCRLCNASVCDECSKKRVSIDNTQVRTCDCCYNRVLTTQKKVNQQELLSSMKPLNQRSTSTAGSTVPTTATSTISTSVDYGSKDKQHREQLFGSAAANNDDKNKRGSVPTSTSRGLAGTMGVMNETHDRLIERGEKLSQLSDRTADMANQANEFARLAKQLNEQQKSRWF